jgi:hypothetical protein
MASAVFPSILHQDPRYCQLGRGGFLRRAEHAVVRLVIPRSDAGGTQANYSEFGGAMIAATIQRTAITREAKTRIRKIASVWGSQMGWDAVTYMIKEFWPDLRKRSTKHREELSPAGQAPCTG